MSRVVPPSLLHSDEETTRGPCRKGRATTSTGRALRTRLVWSGRVSRSGGAGRPVPSTLFWYFRELGLRCVDRPPPPPSMGSTPFGRSLPQRGQEGTPSRVWCTSRKVRTTSGVVVGVWYPPSLRLEGVRRTVLRSLCERSLVVVVFGVPSSSHRNLPSLT